MFISVIIVAGGKGLRLQSSTPKQFLPLKGKPVILHSIDLFLSLPNIGEIIIVCDPSYHSLFPPSIRFAPSGKERQDSVFNGVQATDPRTDLLCIHDAARPCLKKEDALAVINTASSTGAAALATPAINTIKEATADGIVQRTLDRSRLWEVQTPQVVRPDLLARGFELARSQNHTVTDDISLVELTGHRVTLVKGSRSNIKLTTKEDWPLLEAFLSS